MGLCLNFSKTVHLIIKIVTVVLSRNQKWRATKRFHKTKHASDASIIIPEKGRPSTETILYEEHKELELPQKRLKSFTFPYYNNYFNLLLKVTSIM